jgi:negative regulator of flagellin synthesis FlgM
METRTRGLRMKITSTGTPATTPAAPAAPAPAATVPQAAQASGGASAAGTLLAAARAQLQQMPEVDAARVAEIRAALERGEIGFDAAKLAQLIERYHGGRG